jgi:hypothetical protein
MARPRILRPDSGGEIILKNCSKDIVDAVVDAIPDSTDGEVADSHSSASEFSDFAYGIVKDDNKFYIVELGFNKEGGAAVLSSKHCDNYREAINEFKINTGERGALKHG